MSQVLQNGIINFHNYSNLVQTLLFVCSSWIIWVQLDSRRPNEKNHFVSSDVTDTFEALRNSVKFGPSSLLFTLNDTKISSIEIFIGVHWGAEGLGSSGVVLTPTYVGYAKVLNKRKYIPGKTCVMRCYTGTPIQDDNKLSSWIGS